MKIQNQGFDHVEYVLNDIASHGKIYQRMGFEKVGERHLAKKGTRSALWQQGYIRVLLTQSDGTPAADKQLTTQFLKNHAEGCCVLALDVDDATRAFEETTKKGAKPAREP